MNKYQLRLQLNNCKGGADSKPKWHVIFESDEKGMIDNVVEGKGYFLNLCKGNPRLAVFEWDTEKEYYKNIFSDKNF